MTSCPILTGEALSAGPPLLLLLLLEEGRKIWSNKLVKEEEEEEARGKVGAGYAHFRQMHIYLCIFIPSGFS